MFKIIYLNYTRRISKDGFYLKFSKKMFLQLARLLSS